MVETLEPAGLDDTAAEGRAEGRAEHQGPEVDGSTQLVGHLDGIVVGDLVTGRVVASEGVDLVAEVVP
jgi:hypothetical protein